MVEVAEAPCQPGRQLAVSVFTSSITYGASFDEAAAEIDAGDVQALYRLDGEWAPFYCPACEACYCREHWRTWMDFDDGFYDCTWGTCPAGHTRMLDD